MKTVVGKIYNLRHKETGRWCATSRKTGKPYWKLWQPNSCLYDGGPDLDAALERHPELEAVEARADDLKRRGELLGKLDRARSRIAIKTGRI